MATAPTYAEQQPIPRENTLLAGFVDFSFRRLVTPRMLGFLYGLHLFIGLVAAVWYVFSGFQNSVPNGLLALIVAFGGMLLWIVYCRAALEFLAAVFRAAGAITNSQV